MAVRGAAPGAAYGWLIGSIVGLGEAALARSSSLDDGLRVFGWAALIDGAVGIAAGALIGLILVSGKGRGWRVGVAAGAITVGAACAVAFSDGVEVSWPARETALKSGHDIVIIALDRFDPAAVESMPRLKAFGATSLEFPDSVASTPDRAGALAALFTGRLLPGQREHADAPALDVPDMASTLGRYGYRTAAVLQGDGDVERRWEKSFDTVVGVGGAHLLGVDVATSRLTLVRAYSDWRPQPSRRAATAATEAVAALRSPTPGSSMLVVELTDEAGPATIDAALGRVLDAVDARPVPAVVLVTGLRGAEPEVGDLRRSALEVRSWVRFPGGSFASQRFQGGITTTDWFGALARWAWIVLPDTVDVRTDLKLDRVTSTVTDLTLPPADVAPGDPGACNVTGYWSAPAFEMPSWSQVSGGVRRVMRSGHYAYVLSEQDKPALYDDVRDPTWTTDLLVGNVGTCGDLLASARAEAERTRLDRAWSASEQHASVKLAAELPVLFPAVQDPLAIR